MSMATSKSAPRGIKRNVDVLIPMLRFGRFFSIIPTRNNRVFLRYIRAVICICLICGIAIADIYEKQYVFTETSERIIDIATDVALMITCVSQVLSVNLKKGRVFESMHSNLKLVDNDFRYLRSPWEAARNYHIADLIVLHLCCCVYFFYNAYIWVSTYGWFLYLFMFMKDYLYYQVFVMSLIARSYAQCIEYRFDIVNEILNNFETDARGDLYLRDYEMIVSMPGKAWSTTRLSEMITKLTAIVNQYNEVFGFQFVVFYLLIIVCVLMPINTVLVYGSGEKLLMGKKFSIDLMILCVAWLILPAVVAYGVFSACDNATNRASNIPKSCYEVIHKLKLDGTPLKREMLELGQQVTFNPPQFTANGFFVLNYALIFSLIGSISSYVIVLIQFK